MTEKQNKSSSSVHSDKSHPLLQNKQNRTTSTVFIIFVALLASFFLQEFVMPTSDPFLDRDVLPDNVKPVHYDIHLHPDFKTFKFNGHVDVKLKVVKDTNEIWLNAVELQFVQTVLKNAQGQALGPVDESYDEKMETMKFRFGEQMKAGDEVTLSIDFIGVHNEKMAGFYKSTYEDAVTKEKKYMVVTQFEPTDARKAFPCWDEPALKATFDVTLVVPAHMTALSNMNEVSSRVLGDKVKEVKFARSPIMSTYLVAFVVGELSFVETHTKDAQKTLVRVYAPTGLEKQGEFALGVAARTLEFFADYFGIAYPLPKMDMVAIPDFAAGAMENWGLVTYRTVYLLFEEGVSTTKTKQRIAYVVGHELAHQWFGNLVSPGWWADLWLNEGFATWAGWLSTDHLFPEWDIWTQFVNDDFQRGLGLDSLRSSHPIEVPVKNPGEIMQIFDAISYSKSASIIRMLANYLGERDFRQGVRNYLQAFKYRNADTKDLWAHLTDASGGKPVADLMKSWTRQMGYPVLSVKSTGSGELLVQQNRFLSGGGVTPDDDKSIWFAPLQIVTSANPKKPSDDILSERQGTYQLKGINLNTLNDGDFYMLNFNHSGFYRTKYELPLLKRLGKAIADGKLGAADRIGLLTDTFAIARAGNGSAVDSLTLLQNFGGEKDYFVWSEIASELSTLRSIWWQEPQQFLKKLDSFQMRLFGKVVQELGWEYAKGESDLTALLRTLAIGAAGKAGDTAVVSEAQKRFKSFVSGQKDAIHPNLRGAVYSIVLRFGGKAEYDQVLKIYRETSTVDQKLIALSTLGFTKDAELLKQTLEFSLSNEVRPQDIHYAISPVASNSIGKKLAWPFVKANWKTLYDRYYKGSMSLLSTIVSSTNDGFASEEAYQDFRAFFADKDVKAINRAIDQTAEKIKNNAAWLKRDGKAVEEWLVKYAE